MENTNRKNNNLLYLLAGAAIGAGTAYYLNTPQGKKLTSNVVNKGKDVGNQISTQAQNLSKSAVETGTNALETVNEKLAMAKETILEQTDELLNKVESKTNSFKRGIQKAQQKIQNGEVAVTK